MKPRFQFFIITLLLSILVSVIVRYMMPPMLQFLIYQGVHFFFLGLAGLWIVFRFSGFARREHILYIGIATVNAWLGFMAFGLYFFSNANANMPITMTVNLVTGLVMLLDALFLPRSTYEQAHE